MSIETNQAGVQENPIAQGTGGGTAVIVYPKRVELRSRLHSKNTCSVGLGRVTSVRARGLINCALTIEINDVRRLHVEGMRPFPTRGRLKPRPSTREGWQTSD